MIVGIDASRTRIAGALLDQDERIVAVQLRKLPSTDDERERMQAVMSFMRWMDDVASDEGGAVMGVFTEGAYAGPNVKTSMQQAQFIGTVQTVAWMVWPQALIETVGNTEWRKRAGVQMQPGLPYSRPKRQDIKDATRAWAIAHFHGDDIEALTEDEIDALGVAVAGWGIVE